jgi:hypothetical protein
MTICWPSDPYPRREGALVPTALVMTVVGVAIGGRSLGWGCGVLRTGWEAGSRCCGVSCGV